MITCIKKGRLTDYTNLAYYYCIPASPGKIMKHCEIFLKFNSFFVVLFRRVNGSHGFIPANYVQEIEHKLVSVEVKKPVVIKDVRKVKRTQYVKQANPPANQRSGSFW
jgi:hypothetical protein